MANLATWIDQRFGLRPKMTAAEHLKRLPDQDVGTDDEEGEDFLDEGDIQGKSFIIEYCDSAGEVSHRRILIRQLKRAGDGCLCLRAYCYEREAARTFRADRILTLRRLSDPQPLGSAIAFFEKYMHDGVDGAGAAVLKAVRPGLRVLLFLARCDGNVHPLETEVIRNYVDSCSGTTSHWAHVSAFIETQNPDRALARSMLKASLSDRKTAERLLSAANRLAEADGILHEMEIASLEKMFGFSEAARYQEDIR